MGEAKERELRVVQLDGLALLKIIKHCKENVPDVVTGQLLGLDVDGRLEVTNCFPMLEDADEHEQYQLEMMRQLRKVNCDNNAVGWYQSGFLGSFLNQSVIKAQYEYQSKIPNSVVVVYDPFRTTGGKLALKAYRLTQKFMRLYKKNDFSHESFTKSRCDSQDLFEEVPIKVHNSHLVHGFLYELRESKQMSCHYDRLRTSPYSFLQKNLDLLATSIEEYAAEQGKYQFQQRQLARERQALLQKRQATGKPFEEPALPAPSRLETFLISNQINQYCGQIISSSVQGFNKLAVIDVLQSETAPPTTASESPSPSASPAATKEKEVSKSIPEPTSAKDKDKKKVVKKAAPKPKKTK